MRSWSADCGRGLADLFSLARRTTRSLLGNGGTSVFWDVATFGLIERQSQHVTFGEFSSKFAEATAAAPFLADPARDPQPGPAPTPSPWRADDIDLFALTHNETSTGVAMDLRRPAGQGLVVVDATSAAGGLPRRPQQFDVLLLRTAEVLRQSRVGCGWHAARPRRSNASNDRRSGPLGAGVPRSEDRARQLRVDQTYNTPALATLFLLVDQVEWMLPTTAGSTGPSIGATGRPALLYGWADASTVRHTVRGATRPSGSHVVGTIDLDESVRRRRRVRQCCAPTASSTPISYRKLERNQLRIGMFPAIEPDDVATLTAAIDFTINALG